MKIFDPKGKLHDLFANQMKRKFLGEYGNHFEI